MKMVIFSREGGGRGVGRRRAFEEFTSDKIGNHFQWLRRDMLSLELLKEVSNRRKAKNKAKKETEARKDCATK